MSIRRQANTPTHDTPSREPTGRDAEIPREGERVEVYYDAGRWGIRDGDGNDIERTFRGRDRAVANGRSLAREHEGLLVLYDENGEIEEQQDYGAMGQGPGPEDDVTGERGVEATSKAEERVMHRG